VDMREIFGLGFGFLALAALSMAIVNGGQTAAVVTALSSGFASDISAATMQSKQA
jgi:hypothetical protein